MKKKSTASAVVISDDTATLNIDKTEAFLTGLPVKKEVYDEIKSYEQNFLTETVKEIAEELGTVKRSDATNLHGTAKISEYTSVEVVKTSDTSPVVVVRNSYDITSHTLDVMNKLKQKG